MIKNCLFAVALLSLAVASGCAKGGNGVVPPPVTVTVTTPTGVSNGAIYPTQMVTLTAAVTGTTNHAVTWTSSGGGTLTPVTPATDPATAVYVAPATLTSGASVTATSVADTTVADTLSITVTIATVVAPPAVSVGTGLTQQFTAVAIPNDAPQTFTWSCKASGVTCANFHQDANVSGLAYYKAEDSLCSNCVQISAASTLDATCANCTGAKASVIPSRVQGPYAFRFSGYDSSNHATAVVGTFTASSGTITSGTEDELTASGLAHHSITGGSYNPIASSDPNSNNAGTLTLTTGASPNTFRVVLDGAGDIEMIESDGHGTGSGIAEKTSSFNSTVDQTFAFGFTGVDGAGNRIGYAGLMPMDGSGNIVSGSMDVNNGGTNGICDTPPCTVAGAYKQTGGIWQLALTSPVSMTFDFFVANGGTTANNPLTLYAISTDPGTNPAVSGTMVLQDSSKTYNTAAFNGTSVSALTGTGASGTNVSLTLGSTDGNGGFSGQFDQNNAGTTTILAPVAFPGSSTSYTYAASGTSGRYTFNMLGNPTTSTAPLPFVLYASGANRGFLLDQSSSSVITGTMNPQGKGGGVLSDSELPGTWAAATTSSGSSGVDPIAANLLLTFANTGACTSVCIGGTLYDTANSTGVTLAGSIAPTKFVSNGTGSIALTAPSAQNYVIYVVDTSGPCTLLNPTCAIQDFLLMDVDNSNKNASIVFAKQ